MERISMKLHEGEIWHTCSTYLDSADAHLTECAQSLVNVGKAEFAMLKVGTVIR